MRGRVALAVAGLIGMGDIAAAQSVNLTPQAADALRKSARPPTQAEIQMLKMQTAAVTKTPMVINAAAVLAAADAIDLKGWTPLTSGATQGGPSVVSLAKETRIVVRAGDGFLYMAPIDRLNPGTLDGSAWSKISIKPSTEPHCEASYDGERMMCGYLDGGKIATVAWIDSYSAKPISLGGGPLGARPTVDPDPQFSYCNGCGVAGVSTGLVQIYSVRVWDGAGGLWQRTNFTITPISMGFNGAVTPIDMLKSGKSDWQKVVRPFDSPIGCASGSSSDECVAYNGANVGHFVLDKLSSTANFGIAMLGVLPGGAAKGAAPAVVRTKSGAYVYIGVNASGRVFRYQAGKWVPEGGAVKAGSSPSCIANNEQPTCFIQATDGRIYWKKLGTASGL